MCHFYFYVQFPQQGYLRLSHTVFLIHREEQLSVRSASSEFPFINFFSYRDCGRCSAGKGLMTKTQLLNLLEVKHRSTDICLLHNVAPLLSLAFPRICLNVCLSASFMKVYETPFFVAVDHGKKKVVISIRGTLSPKVRFHCLCCFHSNISLTPQTVVNSTLVPQNTCH